MTSDRVMYFRLTIRVYSASKQTRYYLWEKDDKKDDRSGNPEQSDAQRAALLALIPAIQLNKT